MKWNKKDHAAIKREQQKNRMKYLTKQAEKAAKAKAKGGKRKK